MKRTLKYRFKTIYQDDEYCITLVLKLHISMAKSRKQIVKKNKTTKTTKYNKNKQCPTETENTKKKQ